MLRLSGLLLPRLLLSGLLCWLCWTATDAQADLLLESSHGPARSRRSLQRASTPAWRVGSAGQLARVGLCVQMAGFSVGDFVGSPGLVTHVHAGHSTSLNPCLSYLVH